MPFVGSSPLQGVAEALLAGKQLKLQREQQQAEREQGKAYLGLAQGREARLATEEKRKLDQELADQQAQQQIAKLLYAPTQTAQSAPAGFISANGPVSGSKDAGEFNNVAPQAPTFDPEDDQAVQRLMSLPMSPEGRREAFKAVIAHSQERQLRKGALNYATWLDNHAAYGDFGEEGAASAKQAAELLRQMAPGSDPKMIADLIEVTHRKLAEAQDHRTKRIYELADREHTAQAAMQELATLPGGTRNPTYNASLQEITRLQGGAETKDFWERFDAAKQGWVPYMKASGTMGYGPPELVQEHQAMLNQITEARMAAAQAAQAAAEARLSAVGQEKQPTPLAEQTINEKIGREAERMAGYTIDPETYQKVPKKPTEADYANAEALIRRGELPKNGAAIKEDEFDARLKAEGIDPAADVSKLTPEQKATIKRLRAELFPQRQ